VPGSSGGKALTGAALVGGGYAADQLLHSIFGEEWAPHAKEFLRHMLE
jgi:hypothetical protein